MNNELDQLAALAKAVDPKRDYFHDLKVLDVESIDDFAEAASPDKILGLLQQLDSAQRSAKSTEALVERIEVLTKALEFYSNEKCIVMEVDEDGGGQYPCEAPDYDEFGLRAREALRSVSDCEGESK